MGKDNLAASKSSLGTGHDMTSAIKDRPDVGPTAEDILKEKSKSPIFKLASVIVYIMAVTGNGFLLAIFFLFIWDPKIQATRPSHMAEDRGILGRWAPDLLKNYRYTADDGILAQPLRDTPPPNTDVPYHRIMSTEFTDNYISNFYGNIVPGSKHVIPEAPSVLPFQDQEEYDDSTSNPGATSPQHHGETNMHVSSLGSEDSESTSTSNGGPTAAKMTASTSPMHGPIPAA